MLLAVNLVAGNEPVLGLDLQGGISVVLSTEEGATADDLDGIRDLIRDELEGRGIAEPDVRVEGENIIVDLPGVRDQREALDAVDVAGIVQLRPLMSAVHAAGRGAGRARRNRELGGAGRLDVAGVGDGRRRRRQVDDAATTTRNAVGDSAGQAPATRRRRTTSARRRRSDATASTEPPQTIRAGPDDDDGAAARTGRRQPGDDLPADALRPAAAADRRHDHRACRQPTA